MGQMGNQMFQISSTIGIAKKNNEDYIFPPWEYEQYFNLHGCFSNNIKVDKIYNEPHFHYAELPPIKNVGLVGYWQSYRYFMDYDNFIRNIFEFSFSVEKNYNTASIHIRRGDYLKFSDCHTNLSDTYYHKAMSIVDADRYIIFSDDIDWCKGKFIGSQFNFAQGNSPAVDMALMANCSHNIIANSSFSWWGAWLNKNPSKKVIAPTNWFGHALPHNTKDLLPKEWIQI